MKSLLSFFLSLLFYSSQIHAQARVPAANRAEKVNLLAAFNEIRAQILSDGFTHNTCSGILGEYNQRVELTRGDHFENSTLKTNQKEILTASWQSRLALQDKLKVFYQQKTGSADCIKQARRFLNLQRDFEDYMIQAVSVQNIAAKTMSEFAFRDEYPATMINSRFDNFKFPEGLKSGDILMSRGKSFVSAAIARSGESNGQFSHLSLIYIDEKSHKIYTVESHIESGVLVRPLEDHFRYGNLREVIYRYPDEKLAHAAAKFVFEEARKYKEPDTWPYDFKRNMDEASAMDCTEIVRFGFKMASKGEVLFPLYKTQLPKKLMSFVRSIGVETDISFSPEDIEVDPRVEIVGEWRDLTKLQEMRYKNQILSSIFKWMKEEAYTLHFTLYNTFAPKVAWQLRRWPFYLYRDKIPITMPKAFMRAGLALSDAGEMIQERLEIKARPWVSQREYPLTSTEVALQIEKVRQEDWQLYLEGSYRNYENGDLPWPFHEILRP